MRFLFGSLGGKKKLNQRQCVRTTRVHGNSSTNAENVSTARICPTDFNNKSESPPKKMKFQSAKFRPEMAYSNAHRTTSNEQLNLKETHPGTDLLNSLSLCVRIPLNCCRLRLTHLGVNLDV